MNTLTAPKQDESSRLTFGKSGRLGPLAVKIGLLATVDATLLFAISVLLGRGDFGPIALLVAGGVAINWVYLSKRTLPAKYLTPGLAFLAIFQVFIILYTVYIAFTNYSTCHILILL